MSAWSFDSNVLIDALNGLAAAKSEVEAHDDRWISRLTWIEVLSKVSDAQMAATERMLSAFDVDELSLPIAARAAQIRNVREGQRRLKLPDAVILASAQVNGRTLITSNTKDFPPGTPGIHIPYIV